MAKIYMDQASSRNRIGNKKVTMGGGGKWLSNLSGMLVGYNDSDNDDQ